MNKEAAKNVLFELKEILDGLEIEFWLNYATCVGAYRDRAFCEFDEDIDLGVKHEVIVPKMKLLKQVLQQRGFAIMPVSSPFIYERALKVVKNNIHVDIIDYALNDGERFHPHYIHDHAVVHNAYLFENLQTINFLGKEFLIPNPTKEFLVSIYGTEWHVPNLKYDFPEDYRNYRPEYWRTTMYYKPTEKYHQRIKAAWIAYRLEMGSH